MGRQNTETIRFAFGTAARPGSAVWRLNAHRPKGDVYLHNVPQFGANIHVALHASGRFSVKLGAERQRLGPPFKDQFGLYWGLLMFFRDWERTVPPISPSGNIAKIHWLGWPAPGNLYMLKLIYSPVGIDLVPDGDEFVVGTPLSAKVFHSDAWLHIFIQERPMSADEKKKSSISPYSPLDFGGKQPTAIELLRITNTELGPSAIVYEGFELT